MASFSNIFVLFLPEILLSVSCCNVLYVSILLSRLFLSSKSVVKCSTGQSFTQTKVSSYRIGTLGHSHKYFYPELYDGHWHSSIQRVPT